MRINASFRFRTSEHASQRIQQRGVTSENLTLFLEYADQEAPVGGGCEALTLSRAALRQLRDRGVPQQRLERIARLRVIVSGGSIVTVMKVDRSRCLVH